MNQIYDLRMKWLYLEGSSIGGRKEDACQNDIFLEWPKITFLLKEMPKWLHLKIM